MGIKNLFWKIIRNGKPAPYQHGPAHKTESLCPVVHVTAEDLACKCGGNCKCNNPHTNEPAAKKPATKKPTPKKK